METLHCMKLAGELLATHLSVVLQLHYHYFNFTMLIVTMQVLLEPSEHNHSKTTEESRMAQGNNFKLTDWMSIASNLSPASDSYTALSLHA